MHEISLTTNALAARDQATILPLTVDRLVFATNGIRIIDEVSLTISGTGCTAIMGYNGAGKSVLLRLLHGLLLPTGGALKWSGNFDQRTISRRQSMVFQRPVLLRRTVEANVHYALTKRGFSGPARTDKLEAILAETQLDLLRHRTASVLSGGERQRVALARALAAEPEVVFLDEPTASLDPASTLAIEEILNRASMAGRKLILVTQSTGQARRLASDVVFLHRGKVAEHSPIDVFLDRPVSKPARAFVNEQLYD